MKLAADQLVLGIDAGGTKTVAWLARRDDEKDVLGRGSAGPGNPRAAGFETAFANLEASIAAAFAEANITPDPVAAACLALAGADRESERQQLEGWAAARKLAQHVRIVNDALPVLAAGSLDGWGVALISGTGSFAFGRNSSGETVRAGGWGYLLGDEGSGYAIALAALRAVTQAADGRGPATQLSDLILERLKITQPTDLVAAVYGSNLNRADLAALSDVVTIAADRGDAVAERILDSAADDLAEMVAAVASRLHFADASFPLCLTGGVLLNSGSLRELLVDQLKLRQFRAEPITTIPYPVAGAVRLALAAAKSNNC